MWTDCHLTRVRWEAMCFLTGRDQRSGRGQWSRVPQLTVTSTLTITFNIYYFLKAKMVRTPSLFSFPSPFLYNLDTYSFPKNLKAKAPLFPCVFFDDVVPEICNALSGGFLEFRSESKGILVYLLFILFAFGFRWSNYVFRLIYWFRSESEELDESAVINKKFLSLFLWFLSQSLVIFLWFLLHVMDNQKREDGVL